MVQYTADTEHKQGPFGKRNAIDEEFSYANAKILRSILFMNNENLDLVKRVEALELKIDELSQKHSKLIDYVISGGIPKTTAASPMSASPGPVTVDRPIVSHNYVAPNKEKTPRASSAQLLPIVSTICFVMAAIFIVRLAIDSGWLTPVRQWGLLSLLGLALVAGGLLLKKIDSSYRSYLSAGGAIVLFIAAYSSSLYFGIVSQEIALLLGVGVTALCLHQYKEHQNELFAVLTCVGTYVAPILLGSVRADLVYTASFFILWAGLFSMLASYLRTRTLTLLGCYLGIGVFTFLMASVSDPFDLLTVIGVLIAQFMLFCYGVYYYSIKHASPLSHREAVAHLPVLLFFYGATYYFLNKFDATLAPWISLGFVAFIFFIMKSAKKHIKELNSQEMVACFMGVILFHSGYLVLLPDGMKTWLLPVFILAVYISEKKALYQKTSRVLKAFFLLIGAIEFAKTCYNLFDHSTWETSLSAAVTVGLGLFYYLQGSRLVKNQTQLFLGLLHLLAVLMLYRIGYDTGSLAVSVLWALYSIAILVVGYVRKDAALAKSSLLVLTITSLKALLYDASHSASGIRILSLLVTGVVLYGSGWLLKKINAWKAE